jgi:small subunit ribosomal protein S1
MADEIKTTVADDNRSDDFKKLLETNDFKIPQMGDLIRGKVITASKAEVKLDIGGFVTGVVRGPELYEEDDDYADLEPGDEVEATVIDDENENGELELSFRFAGQEKAWSGLRKAFQNREMLKVKIVDANKGGLLVKYRQIAGFLPVSQLAPENYPRINGGDKSKILEKLKSFAGRDFEVKVMTLEEKEDKIIFSEKEAWNEKQKDVIQKYKVGTVVEGTITAITDFGVFVSFGDNMEGLIHISELAWQRIDDPADLFKVGETIKAEVISVENGKIFLSAKKLIHDPWTEVGKKFKIGQTVPGTILKVNPFGLFVKLDDDIHGLAHISQIGLGPKEKIQDLFHAKDVIDFEIVSIEPKEHRLGLAVPVIKGKKQEETSDKKKEEATVEKKEEAKEVEKEEKPKVKKETKAKAPARHASQGEAGGEKIEKKEKKEKPAKKAKK